jgi:hypothetical protein
MLIATTVRVTAVAISLVDRALRRTIVESWLRQQLPSRAERTIHLA